MRPRNFALAAVVLLAGCGADSSVSPSIPVDLNEVFQEMNLPAMAGATSAATPYVGSTGSAFSGVPTGCSYVPASSSFVCAPITVGGLTITQSYQLLNSNGSPLSAFDATSLAAVRVQSRITGTETNAAGTSTTDTHIDRTLSGLQTSKHVLNGVTTMNASGTYGTGTLTVPFTSTMTTTTTDLVIPANSGPNTYPASGTITIDDTSTSFTGLPLGPTRMVITFNGTSKVKVTINGVAPAGCSTIDLSPTSPGCS